MIKQDRAFACLIHKTEQEGDRFPCAYEKVCFAFSGIDKHKLAEDYREYQEYLGDDRRDDIGFEGNTLDH